MASMAHFSAEQALQLLDFSHKMDVPLLDAVVTSFYSTVGSEVRGWRDGRQCCQCMAVDI